MSMSPVRAAPLLRIPYTSPLPAPRILPASANTTAGAVSALVDFLAPASPRTRDGQAGSGQALLLTGAGLSVASGLADYRGAKGTYTLNKTYRPIYYHEFCEKHEMRKRYWARSFLGWSSMRKAQPNAGHAAIKKLGELGTVGAVITQNVDSFHLAAHPALATIELHGWLRSLTCLTCATAYDRDRFQAHLARLNPAWAAFLQDVLRTGALDTENPDERRSRGLKSNPDGDVDIPGAPYTTFRYPACPTCLSARDPGVRVDDDGAWREGSTAGVLKPSVVMFGESIPPERKNAAEQAVNRASRLLVVGSSLATYSAWRLAKQAKDLGLPIAILNIGGVRGEETLFAGISDSDTGRHAVRCSESADIVLPEVAKALEQVGQ